MLNCMRTRLIILAVVLIFCDSHENQIDDISLSSSSTLTTTATTDDGIPVDENLIDSDDTKNFSTIEFEMNKTTKLDSRNSSLTSSTMVFAGIALLPTKSTVSIRSEEATSKSTTTKQPTTAAMATTLSHSSNSPELTTEKLSLTNKSLLFSPMAESQTRDILGPSSTTNNISNAKNTNFKQHRTINSNVFHPISGGVRIKGQKIEMPQLNDFVDHNEYLKKHEKGFRYGPHFETGNVTNITVQVGNTFYLHCKISLLQDKTVSWVRRKSGENGLELLTVGKQTYSGDPRYSVDFQYPNNWRLRIDAALKIDEGTYECQISTSPPRFIFYNVKVNAPTIRIVDEKGIPLLDKYYEVDSTIQLTCIVRHISMISSVVYWIHNNSTILNHDVSRGGISVKSDLMEIGANSTLLVARVNKTDSGNYTCSIGGIQQYTVLVHVLNEESLAELHHSGSSSSMHHINSHNRKMWKINSVNFLFFVIALLSSSFNCLWIKR